MQEPLLWECPVSPGLSGSQGHWEWAAFLELDPAASCLLGSSYSEGHIQSHLREEEGTRGAWMPEGNRHLCCQWKHDGARGSEQLSHDGDELSGALPCPHHEGGEWEQHQRSPLKPSQPARHRPRHSPCKTPGKSAKRSIFSLLTVRCISFPPTLTACCPGSEGCLSDPCYLHGNKIYLHSFQTH